MGVGLVGILRPLIIYPSAAVYYYTLPMVAIFQMLHYEAKGNRIRNFGLLFAGTCLWEPIVAYICPWLNGVSVFCLASMGAPMNIRRHIARIFGGASPNQGMAFLSLSFDPQYVSPSTYAGFPLKWQVMYWAGMYAGAIIMLIIYYTDTWQAKSLPFLSRTLFKADGSVWPQDEVFDGASASLNVEALARNGAPRLTASTVWAYFAQVTAIGALVTHILLFQGKEWVYSCAQEKMKCLRRLLTRSSHARRPAVCSALSANIVQTRTMTHTTWRCASIQKCRSGSTLASSRWRSAPP